MTPFKLGDRVVIVGSKGAVGRVEGVDKINHVARVYFGVLDGQRTRNDVSWDDLALADQSPSKV